MEAKLAVTTTKMLVNAKERKALDLDQVKYIKDEEGEVLTEEILITQRWKAYFHKLLKEEGAKTLF
ncbi:hypothetical protein H5410_035956 [Solanum commersonii]|uniref:Uncharacterized protein n=1 Tax=Solanum commersonii TaxID=4109 RepID=A0A9J5Y663_SOLCO|nr:hypothetical protein H5410_035956 [Solanum commersonii]